MANSNTITTGPAFLALRVDALLRLDRFAEAAAAISATEAVHLGHERFIAASLAAARFRLLPALDEALTAASAAAAAAPWPWLHALVGCWRGEFLQDADAAEGARRQFEAIGAPLGVQRTEAVLRRPGAKLPGQNAAPASFPRARWKWRTWSLRAWPIRPSPGAFS